MGYVGKVNAGGSEHLVGSTLYGTCDTAESTAAKVVVCPDFTTLIEGVTIHVKFDNSNTATNPTLNVNSTGAKRIRFATNSAPGTDARESWYPGEVVALTYDGTYWCINSKKDFGRTNEHLKPSTNSRVYLAGAYTPTFPSSAFQIDSLDINSAIYHDNGALHAASYNGYTLGAACEKAVGSVASGNTGLVTGGDVFTAIQSAAAGSLQYQGTATSDSDIGTSYHAGWYWVVGSAGGTIAGQTVEAGDMVLAHADYSGTLADDLDIVQSNIDRITNSDIDTIVAA